MDLHGRGLMIVSFDGAIGDEDEILPVLAKFSDPGTYMLWHFDNGEIVRRTVTTTATWRLQSSCSHP
jgi:hypothetical protein